MQASFVTKIVSDASTVLFNTELESQSGQSGGMIEYVFARTPPMATYLVGIVVGELEANHMLVDVTYGDGSADQSKLPVTVYSRIGYGAYVDLAKHAAAAAVQGMSSYVCYRTLCSAWHSLFWAFPFCSPAAKELMQAACVPKLVTLNHTFDPWWPSAVVRSVKVCLG